MLCLLSLPTTRGLPSPRLLQFYMSLLSFAHVNLITNSPTYKPTSVYFCWLNNCCPSNISTANCVSVPWVHLPEWMLQWNSESTWLKHLCECCLCNPLWKMACQDPPIFHIIWVYAVLKEVKIQRQLHNRPEGSNWAFPEELEQHMENIKIQLHNTYFSPQNFRENCT